MSNNAELQPGQLLTGPLFSEPMRVETVRANGPDTWVAEKIFTKRIPHTVEFQIDRAEFDLYRDITRFVKQQSSKAAAQGDDPRARAVGFLMSLYQRRLASSTYAMRHSLENRAKRLEEGLKRAQDLARLAPPDLPDPEELEEMEESERERLEETLEAITLAANTEQVREEVQELRQLADQARAVEDSGAEAKLSKLKELLQQEGFFDHPDKRLQPNPETEATAMRVVMDYERSQGRQVYDVHDKNLGYDVTSLDLNSGELRLIEVKGLAGAQGNILLTPNERRVAEDRRDCYWLYVVTNCATTPQLQEPIKDPARFPWHEVTKVAHYWLSVNALAQPMRVQEESPNYGGIE